MPFDADDLAAFNDPDMPGYAVATIGGVDVAGRFRAAYADVLGMSGTRPVFSAPLDELAGVDEGAAVVIGGVSYEVEEVKRPDPLALHHCLLILSESA